MQVYSHDAAFSNGGVDSVSGLLNYQLPTLPAGVVMSEELAETMPKNFIYRRLDNDNCAAILNTYLGRDYMGSTGRFGNYLSHAIICDEPAFIVYPCELYGSDSLLSKAPDGVKSADTPDYLPEPNLTGSETISPESISNFLATDNRMDAYKKMLAAMLLYKSARKRVVICDLPEHTIMWIAALHFALPLKIALNVNFSTYDYDPSLSASQICGVLPEGTRYNINDADNHFTFDFINNIVPEIQAEGDFFDFIEMGMSLSYNSIEYFHEFVRDELSYSAADEHYYQIYSLYCLLSDGMENMPLQTFKNVIQMAHNYVVDKGSVVERLLENRDFVLSRTDEYSMEVTKALLKLSTGARYEIKDAVTTLIVEKIISLFASSSLSESELKQFYAELKNIADYTGIDVLFELAKDDHQNKLIEAMQFVSEEWQWNFVADNICEYIKTQRIPIDKSFAEHPLGKLLSEIIALCEAGNTDDGIALAKRCLKRFAGSWKELIHITAGLQNILQEVSTLWKCAIALMAANHRDSKKEVCDFLVRREQYDKIIGLYQEWMKYANDIKEAKALFGEQMEMGYALPHYSEICENYYEFLRNRNISGEEKLLLDLILHHNIKFKYMDVLVEDIIADFPIVVSSGKHADLLSSIIEYYKHRNRTYDTGRLLILAAGMILSRGIYGGKSLEIVAEDIKISAGGRSISLSSIPPKEAVKYINWITPNVFKSCRTAKDLLAVYDLFEHTEGSASEFIAICAKEALHAFKDQSTMLEIYLLLELLFYAGNDDDRIEIGKLFLKQSNDVLNDIDDFVTSEFAGNEDCLLKWDEVYRIATKAVAVPKKGGFFF